MKEIAITLAGEEAVFSWRDGKVYCEGYDLESEKIALAIINSYTKGVGLLLVSIDACCRNEKEFISEVKNFVAGHRRTISADYKDWPKGQLLFEYYSYSSDVQIRWGGLNYARLSKKHYERLWADPEMKNKVKMARLPQLPRKYFYQLMDLCRSDVNYQLAQNRNCPSDILEIFASSKDRNMRGFVGGNPGCPQGIIGHLAKDKLEWVRRSVARNPSCTEEIFKVFVTLKING